jgi:RNA polymerase sigma factor (sigma-70 family)
MTGVATLSVMSSDAATDLWLSGCHADGLSLAFREHRVRMYATARRIVGDEHVADVAQEVLLRVWRFPDRFDPERSTLGTYLCVVNRSVAVDQLRSGVARRRREDWLHWIDVVRHPDVSVTAIEQELAARVNEALMSIPVPERDALVCAFFGDMTYAQTAARLGIPEGTIKSRIRRGITHLRYELRDLL